MIILFYYKKDKKNKKVKKQNLKKLSFAPESDQNITEASPPRNNPLKLRYFFPEYSG